MNRVACQYAIVRFTPFVETGEFANVGVLVMVSRARYFGFKLQTRRFGRITRFFEGLEPRLYRQTLSTVRDELERVQDLLKANGFNGRRSSPDLDFAQHLFTEVVRPRESIIRFSEPGIVIAEDPAAQLEALFAYYVERNFVTREYVEIQLEKGIRKWLDQEKLSERFQRAVIGDDDYQTGFPFVEQTDHEPVKIIKPLHLAQDSPSKIIDHGGTWLFRLDELRRRNKLPGKVLFAVAGPEGSEDDRRRHAFDEIVGRLTETGVDVTDCNNRKRVLQFARLQ